MIFDDKFRFDTAKKGDRSVVFLKGAIDEDTDFSAIKKIGGPLVFNFRDLTAINSCGIRAWVNFLKEISGTAIDYEECPPLVVRQMNMVPSFLGPSNVVSVYVPYLCTACEREKLVLAEKAAFWKTPLKIEETFKCEFCNKGEMEIDGNPKQYFAFAK